MLFVSGADEQSLLAGPDSEADVLMQELEDFKTSDNRPLARQLAPVILATDLGVEREPDALELPTVTNAKRLLARHEQLAQFDRQKI